MPAKKPIDLHADYGHRARYERRKRAEESTSPKGRIPLNPPVSLRGDSAAAQTWRRLARLYNQLEAKIITRLDLGVFERYCQLRARIDRLQELQSQASGIDQQLQLDRVLLTSIRLENELAKSLLLTPRSRSGVAPAEQPAKESPPPAQPEGIRFEDLEFFREHGRWPGEDES